MYTKWLIIGALAVAIGFHHAAPAFAQDAHGTKPGVEMDLQKIAGFLNLTPDQVRQIKTIREQYTQGVVALKKQTNLTEPQRKQRFEQLRQGADKSLRQVLNADQIAHLQAHGGLGVLLGDGVTMGMFDMLTKIGLSDEQMVKVKTIAMDVHQAMDNVKSDPSLTPQQIKERIEQIHQEAMQQIHAILTPAQMKRLQQMHNGEVPPKP